MRIALLSSWWRSHERGSGTAAAIDGLAGGLTALGHTVVRIGSEGSSTLPARLRHNLGMPGQVATGRFDLVVGFDWDGLLCRKVPGQPYVVALKGVLADEGRFERGLPRLSLSAQSLLERINIRRADRVVVPSRYSRERAVAAYRLPPERVAVVPEGIDPGLWEGPGPARHSVPTILTVARQYPRKNTRTLIAALPRVKEAVPDVRLRIVGGGPELPALKRQAARLGLDDDVSFLGELPDDRAVRGEYLSAHLFCLPSLQEGFGIVFLEAMAAGLPVVAGDTGAAPEVVADGVTGRLVPPEDVERLAECLIDLLNDRVPQRMGEAGRQRVRQFAWPKIARRFLDAATQSTANHVREINA